MRFQTDIGRAAIPDLIGRMVFLTGDGPWAKRFEWLARESAENPYMGEWLEDRFAVELSLFRALTDDSGQISGDGPLDRGAYELAAFAAGLVSLHDALSDKGRKRLRGQLLDGLKSDPGSLPLQLEISTLTHLVRAGYEVQAHDLEAGGGFDFLASRDGKEVEVECKLASGDIGRKIHRRQAAKLFHSLATALEPVVATATRGLLVQVTLPDRLTPSLVQHTAIVDAVRLALLGATEHSQVCTVRVHEFDIERSPFAAGLDARGRKSDVKAFVSKLTGRNNTPSMATILPGERAVCIALDSVKTDAVLNGIRRQLRDASEQLTGQRPGCVVTELHDLSEAQLLSLIEADSPVRVGATGLQLMTSDLLQSPARSHVHSVVYRGRGDLSSAQGATLGRGYTYVVKNAWHPDAEDPRCRLFGSVKIPGRLITPA